MIAFHKFYTIMQNTFLPYYFGNDGDIGNSIAAKVLCMYKDLPDISAPSRHGVTQLLLRLKYMIFSHCPSNSSIEDDINNNTNFDDEMLLSIQNYTVSVDDMNVYQNGAEPRFDIFDRPIYGLWMPVKRVTVAVAVKGETKNGGDENGTSRVDESSSYEVYPTASAGGKIYDNALQAVQDISFGSIKYRHSITKKKDKTDYSSSSAPTLTLIDDILIANTIAQCADAKDNVIDTESYNHTWRWYDSDDNANGIEKLFTTVVDRIPDSSNFNNKQSSTIWDYRTLFTKLCGQDTTL
jgi:hypothetical protein